MASKFTCEAVARAALGGPAKRQGGESYFRCPYPERHTNGDADPSLKIKKDVFLEPICGAKGKAWRLAAFPAGCDPADKPTVTAWLREKAMVENRRRFTNTKMKGTLLLFEVERSPGKEFKQRRPDSHGSRIYHRDCEKSDQCECNPRLPPVRRLPYNLPALLKAQDVLIVEGRKRRRHCGQAGNHRDV
jgi:hypothetical protein